MVGVKNQKGSTGSKFLIGAGVIVVLLIVAVALIGWPPSNGTEGTIGAAKKYQADQIKDTDVTLEDPEIQELLQDNEVVAFLNSDEFRRLVEDDELMNMACQEGVWAIINGTEFDKWYTGPIKERTLRDPVFMRMLEIEQFANWAGSIGRRTIEDPVFARLVQFDQFRALFTDTEFLRIVNETADFRKALEYVFKENQDNEFARWAVQAEFEAFANKYNEEMRRLVLIPEFARWYETDRLAADNFLKNDLVHRWFENEQFARWQTLPRFRRLALSNNLDRIKLMSNMLAEENSAVFNRLTAMPKFSLMMLDPVMRRNFMDNVFARFKEIESQE
jgi:hypothetical protein